MNSLKSKFRYYLKIQNFVTEQKSKTSLVSENSKFRSKGPPQRAKNVLKIQLLEPKIRFQKLFLKPNVWLSPYCKKPKFVFENLKFVLKNRK